MYQPEAYGIALRFIIASVLSWGSWENTIETRARISFCGVMIWNELARAPSASRKLNPAIFLLFLVGRESIAIARP
jgi:hypothetical protein